MNHKDNYKIGNIHNILLTNIYMKHIISNYLYPCYMFRIKERKRMDDIKMKNINRFVIANNVNNTQYINIVHGLQFKIEWITLKNTIYIYSYNCTIGINDTNHHIINDTNINIMLLPLYIDISKINSIANMFYLNTHFNSDISRWDTSHVINMSGLFNTSNFNNNISRWDTSNVVHMFNMFKKTKFNGNISKWNITNVLTMTEMFHVSMFNGDISRWNTINVTKMEYMFSSTYFNGNISMWNTSNVNDMEGMFNNSKFRGNISMWNTSNVNNMMAMFANSQFNSDISMWDTSNVNSMMGMFYNSGFNSDISMWNTSNVKDMSEMFKDNSRFNIKYIKNWFIPHNSINDLL
jgi:surface protein